MNYKEKGFAAWYSRDSQNRLTTNGEVFDDEKMTAAHKTLPLPSLVRITNLENGNTAIVRVNDRGPSVNNRLMDVSQKVAEALEMQISGTTFIQVEILPDESLRLKEGLKEYVDPLKETQAVDLSSDDSNRPIYQDNTPEMMPIYENNTFAVVQTEALEPIGSKVSTASKDLEISTEQSETMMMPNLFKIQVGVFGNEANLKRAVESLEKIATVETEQKGFNTVVRVVADKNNINEKALLDKVRQAGYKDAWIKK